MNTIEPRSCLLCEKLNITNAQRVAIRLTNNCTEKLTCTHDQYRPNEGDHLNLIFSQCSKFTHTAEKPHELLPRLQTHKI